MSKNNLGGHPENGDNCLPETFHCFFYVMFEYPTIIAITCLILWKQMNNEELEHRMMNRGLSGISPLAFMNFIRIYLISFHEYEWRNWKNLSDSLPRITNEEWEEIYRYVPRDQLTTLINLYQNPSQMLPTSGSGRNTPTRFYMQILGEYFYHQVRNRTNGDQSTLELTRDDNGSGFNLIPRTIHNTALSIPRDGQNLNNTTEPSFQIHPSLASILRTERTLLTTSAQVKFHPQLLNNHVSINTPQAT